MTGKTKIIALVASTLLIAMSGGLIVFQHQSENSTVRFESLQPIGDTEGDFYTSDDVRIHYWYYNRGTPIVSVFLHGGPGGSTSDLRVIGQAKNYADTFGSLLLFDQRGGGQSEKSADLAESITYPRFIEDINELRGFVIPDQDVVIFGRSFGGPLAIQYANSHPNGVRGYILAAPGPLTGDNKILENQRQQLLDSVGEDTLVEVAHKERDIILKLVEDRGIRDPETIPIPDGEDTELDLGTAFITYGDYFTQNEYSLLFVLNNVPTLVVYGAYDTQVPPLSVEAMKPYLPNATFLELPGGHGAAYAHEEEFFAAVRELFKQIEE